MHDNIRYRLPSLERFDFIFSTLTLTMAGVESFKLIIWSTDIKFLNFLGK